MKMAPIVMECIEAAGSIARLARALGIRHQSIYSWERVPAERVLAVEKATGISRHRIRGDIYPQPD